MKRLLTLFFLWLGTLNGWAQAPSPAQVGITTDVPNVVQVYDSSHNWATIGTIDPVTHLFTVVGGGSNVTSFNTRTGAVTLSSGDVTGALGFTPIPASGAPVQSVATRTGAVTLTHTDITDWATTLTPYALLASPAFSGVPTAPTPSPGDSSTKLATTAFVGAAVTAGAYTLPVATPSVLGGVKPDGSTITVTGGGVISGTPSGITANTTPTSGFSAGQLLISDGSKVQASNGGTVGAGFPTTLYLYGQYQAYTFAYGGANYLSFGVWGQNFVSLPSNVSLAWWLDSVSGPANNIGTSLGVEYNTAGLLEQRYGAAPQNYRVYNTYTDGSNGEWGALDWQTTANVLSVGTEKNGTGTARNLELVVGGVNKLDYGVTVANAWSSIGNFGSTGAMVARGTAPTITGAGGTCATSTKVGGAWAGTVVLSGVCATTNTIAWTGMPAVPNGYVCDAEDRTTQTAGPFIESAATTTGFTLKVGATSSVAADVLQWKCMGY